MPSKRIRKKALKLLLEDRVKRMEKNWYEVKGDHSTYQVSLSRMSCTCQYFSLHQRPCSHILASWLLDRINEFEYYEKILEKGIKEIEREG